MVDNKGEIIKYSLIAILVFLLIFITLGYNGYFNINNDSNDNNYNDSIIINDTYIRLPQCSDGIDNDNDGYIDREDKNCKDNLDDSESNIEVIYWFGFVIGGLIIYFTINYIIKIKKKPKKTEGILEKTVGSDKGYQLALNWFLSEKAKDIGKRALIIGNNIKDYILTPLNDDDIVEYYRMPHKHKDTGEYFQISFIKVKKGYWRGYHVMMYSMSKGEQHILDGIERFESGKYEMTSGKWTRNPRDYNMSVQQDKADRLALAKLEAYNSGNDSGLEELDILMNDFKSNNQIDNKNNVDDDMSQEEYNRMVADKRRQSMLKKPKKIAKNTYNNNNILPDFDGDFENE